MHIQNIFGGIEVESKTFLDLILENDPYEINYPESEMVNIMLSSDEGKGAILSLIPRLTTQSLSTYSESNRTQTFENCILSTDIEHKYKNIQIYFVDKIHNRGYAISSEDNKTNRDIINQICFSSSRTRRDSLIPKVNLR